MRSSEPAKAAKLLRLSSCIVGSERTFTYLAEDVKVQPATLNNRRGGRPNRVSTTRFTPLTWMPKSLFYQFKRVANLYFLIIAIIVLALRDDSPKNWKSKVFPFIGVLLWTALKDLYEDFCRYRDNEEENRRKCLRYNAVRGEFEPVEWQRVLAGDLLYVSCDEAFPADLLILQAASGNEAFISTVNLDGETNLKERSMPSLCGKLRSVNRQRSSQALGGDLAHAQQMEAAQLTKQLYTRSLSIQMGDAKPSLTEVRGKIMLDGEECHAGEANFLPRGCVLRNTVWVIAAAVYVGDETKTRLNAVEYSTKTSNMQRYLNRCIEGLLAVLVLVVAMCATLSQIVGSEDNWLVAFLKYCVTFYHVVPVSLYIMFETFKLLLGMQVNLDKQMVDPATGQGAVARTVDLMEELGQIDFVFSDKTGTLTANEMIFARCCVDGQDLGDFRKASGCPLGLVTAETVLGDPKDPLYKATHQLFTCLAICHAVRVEEKHCDTGTEDDGGEKLIYSGVSPDEVALVQAASDAGIVYRRFNRDTATSTTELTVLGPAKDEERQFQVLQELEFNSDRKRMSVIVRQGDEVFCVTKGADNIMADLMDRPFDPETLDHLSNFSQQGLRTLVVGMRKVDPEFLEQWQKDMHAARNRVDSSREEKVAEVAARIETSLSLVGVTAVEDRLQDDVPNAIQTVKDAGIRVWVLTGDKIETAVDIAKSCSLFNGFTSLAYATQAMSQTEAQEKLTAAKEKLLSNPNSGLVLDSLTVKYALKEAETRSLIYELGMASRSCVCCRLSPMQKRQLVELVREANPKTITLAIGDGANDVPMIEGAHIGIGIRGKEGTQAVQVSDIAISQFRFLVPLLFCHGRRAYRRVAIFLLFYLYKNVALVMADIVWSIQDRFRGNIAYPEYLSMGFNVFFTSWHILFVLGFDRGVPDHIANSHPELYSDGPERKLFNPSMFAVWMLYAAWHGSVCWLLPNLWYGGKDYTALPSVFWLSSCASFTTTILVVNTRLLMCCMNPLKLPAVLSTLGSYALYFGTFFCLGEVALGYTMDGNEKLEGIPTSMFSSGRVVCSIVVTPLLALSADVVEKIVRYFWFPTPMDRLRESAWSWAECVQELKAGDTVRITEDGLPDRRTPSGSRSAKVAPMDVPELAAHS